ncbi:MAG: LysR family transcriptional regulator [Pseudonocardiaceae bacterium]|nr:LysR family transcriptional regulator [Pseudonocardiaceae bacterium]
MLDLTRLRVLVTVAREGSVTAAAEALHYAQPSVSHHLARLEAELGVPLVQRVGRGIRLTEAGRLLVDRAEEILGQVESTRTELAAHAGLRTGRVRLAAFPSALATLVPPAAARLAVAHPDIELALTEAEPPEALAALRNADIDVALIFEHDEPSTGDHRNTTVTTLLEEPLYVVTPADRDWQGSRSELATYAAERWIAGCERCRAHLLSACGRAGFTPIVEFETDDYVAVQALVAAGLGVSTLPGLALAANRHSGVRIDRLAQDGRRVMAATYGKPPAPLPVQAFLDALAETGPPPLTAR